MYPAQFDYKRATSVEEALALLTEADDVKFIAGGHSLIPMMKLRLAQPEMVVDIARIDALRGITEEGDGVRIGALTTHAEIAASSVLHEHCGLIAEAAAEIGDTQVRNRGTIGGNIAHADPGSDLPAALIAAGATVHLQSASSTRTVAAADFFLDLLTTDLSHDELVVAVTIPSLGRSTGCAYLKFEHPASGYAVVGAAAWVKMENRQCSGAGLAINGVTATPFNGNEIAQSLVSTDASDDRIAAAVESVQPEDPMADVFASADYRAHLARVFAKRALVSARDRAV